MTVINVKNYATAGTSTCPICKRTWTVTQFDDCCLPACGCYGDDVSEKNPNRTCQKCGVHHALNCKKMEGAE